MLRVARVARLRAALALFLCSLLWHTLEPRPCLKACAHPPLGAVPQCVANSKYGCNDQATDSCCDTTGNYACSLGLGGGLYVCRKTCVPGLLAWGGCG